MYRWAPGNRTTIRTEPAPSELFKATGIGPRKRERQNPPLFNIRCGAGPDKGPVGNGPLAFCSPIVHVWGMTAFVQPGQILARGTCRYLRDLGYACVTEMVPVRGLRVDVMALGPKGEIWVVECKSSRADFQADHKWQGYLEWCDRYFWAVDQEFDTDLLPSDTGLIIADRFDADIIRMGPETKLPAARRTALTRKFARHAADRLHRLQYTLT